MKKCVLRPAALLAALCLCMPAGAASLPLKEQTPASDCLPLEKDSVYAAADRYAAVLNGYAAAGLTAPAVDAVTLPGGAARLPAGTADADGALVWTQEAWAEWTFTAAADGLYQLEITYTPSADEVSDITRSLLIDGKAPFQEAEELHLYRHWADAREPAVNRLGNEVKAPQTQLAEPVTTRLYDSRGLYSEPLTFALTQGTHTLRLLYIDGAMTVHTLRVLPAETIPDYAAYRKSLSADPVSLAVPLCVQAESQTVWKTRQTLSREYDGDPSTVPQKETRVLNIFGGTNWKNGGEAACWRFRVEESGLYTIGLRVKQSYGDGLPSARTIAIDGSVPFAELTAYSFPYRRDWYIETLSAADGTPFLFELSAGEHTITLTARQSEAGQIADGMENTVSSLLALTRRIRLITGSAPDVNYDYRLPDKIPGLLTDMSGASAALRALSRRLEAVSSARSSAVSEIDMAADQLDSLCRAPDTIARRLSELSDSLSTLSTASARLREQALAIDYFCLGDGTVSFGTGRSGFWQKLFSSMRSFLRSFILDYDAVGGTADTADCPVIEVWVSRGQEWAEVMKQLIDDRFTREHRIGVRMNLLPASQLNAGAVSAVLLAVSAGDAPDVAVGVAYNTPAEFAFRKAVIDLTRFDDYDEIASRFYPQTQIPFTYRGGVYALPETMNFRVLFYRRDVLGSLGLGIPQTWNDIYRSVLPVLTQNGMEFYFPKDSSPFLYQHGADYYNAEQTASALDTAEGYAAVKEYTELFTVYGVPNVANFFNRFRSGEMPIGVEGTSMYLQLLSAAPELTGKWGIALLPGHKRADGTIDRSAAGLSGETAVIFSQSTHPDEAWEFLKWWTEEEVQVTFGQQIESVLGTAARWNSANIAAFSKAPWNRRHLSVFAEQMQQLRDMPTLPGSYMNTRHLENLWNRIVLEKVSVRDSLEQAVEDIDRELRTKAAEFS